MVRLSVLTVTLISLLTLQTNAGVESYQAVAAAYQRAANIKSAKDASAMDKFGNGINAVLLNFKNHSFTVRVWSLFEFITNGLNVNFKEAADHTYKNKNVMWGAQFKASLKILEPNQLALISLSDEVGYKTQIDVFVYKADLYGESKKLAQLFVVDRVTSTNSVPLQYNLTWGDTNTTFTEASEDFRPLDSADIWWKILVEKKLSFVSPGVDQINFNLVPQAAESSQLQFNIRK